MKAALRAFLLLIVVVAILGGGVAYSIVREDTTSRATPSTPHEPPHH